MPKFQHFHPDHQVRPYWWEDIDLLATCEDISALPEAADVAVIGGGFTGLSAALTLARAGKSVVVLDTETPGYGCSSRNGGLIGPSFHKLGLKGLTAAYGEAQAVEIIKESLNCLESLVTFIEDESIDCDLRRNGRFRGAVRPAHFDQLAREIETLNKAVDFPAEMVSRADQRNDIGSDAYHGGAIYHLDGHLHPGKYAEGLARLATAAGAKLFGGAFVHSVSRQNDGFAVDVNGHSLKAGEVLVATNGYTDKSFPQFRRRLIPLRSAIIATEPLDEVVTRELSPKNRGFVDSARLVLYYRLSPDGSRVLFGGRAFDVVERPERYTTDLYDQMTRIFPQLKGSKVTHSWSGTVAYTFDHAPHLGQIDGLWYCMGYCGSGVGRATYYGRKAALKILGREEGRTALDGLSFEGRPFYTGTPWFIPALLRWHALADKMGL